MKLNRLLGLFALSFASSTACSSNGSNAGGDAGPSPSAEACAADPFDTRCLGDSAGALFVSGQAGSDVLGDGTQGKPLKTLWAALGRLSASRRRVYLCEGRYDEDVILGAAHAALVLVGGLDCSWMPNGSRARVGTGKTVPIHIEPAETPITIDGIEAHSGVVLACDAGRCTSDAKIVAIAHGDVTFRRVRFVAERGADGADGSSDPIAMTGVPAGYPMGGGTACANGERSGGGSGGVSSVSPGSGAPGPTPDAGKNDVACNAGGDGQDGAAGANGIRSGDGAADIGTLRAGGGQCPDGKGGNACFYAYWLPRAGVAGESGKVGQGGGGGGSGPAGSGTGGGGGAGGCAGAGGGGGAGGGASIAVVSVDAHVAVRDSSFETAGGGRGGVGGAGGTGSGGLPGAPALNGCGGGAGGGGGKGAIGGGGAGGVSVGVLYVGIAPDVDPATAAAMNLGPAGKGGAGTNAGVDGRLAATLEATRAE